MSKKNRILKLSYNFGLNFINLFSNVPKGKSNIIEYYNEFQKIAGQLSAIDILRIGLPWPNKRGDNFYKEDFKTVCLILKKMKITPIFILTGDPNRTRLWKGFYGPQQKLFWTNELRTLMIEAHSYFGYDYIIEPMFQPHKYLTTQGAKGKIDLYKWGKLITDIMYSFGYTQDNLSLSVSMGDTKDNRTRDMYMASAQDYLDENGHAKPDIDDLKTWRTFIASYTDFSGLQSVIGPAPYDDAHKKTGYHVSHLNTCFEFNTYDTKICGHELMDAIYETMKENKKGKQVLFTACADDLFSFTDCVLPMIQAHEKLYNKPVPKSWRTEKKIDIVSQVFDVKPEPIVKPEPKPIIIKEEEEVKPIKEEPKKPIIKEEKKGILESIKNWYNSRSIWEKVLMLLGIIRLFGWFVFPKFMNYKG